MLYQLTAHNRSGAPGLLPTIELEATDTSPCIQDKHAICYQNLLDTLTIQSQPQGLTINLLRELATLLMNTPGETPK